MFKPTFGFGKPFSWANCGHGRPSNGKEKQGEAKTRIPMVRRAQPAICALFWRTAVILPVILPVILKVEGVSLGLNVSGAYGQTTGPQRPEFEVASVKPHSASEGSPNVSIARDPGRLS